MTTFQDPPPHSRRAARASERSEAPAAESPVAGEPVPYSFDQGGAPAAEQPSEQPSEPTTAQSGRRAQNRVAPPPDAQVAAPLSDQPPPGHAGGHASGEAADQPPFRVRDYSPEGRRSAGQPPAPTAAFAPPARPVELDYQTQGVPPGGSHAATPAVPLEDTMNHTLSRRELREMRAAEEAQAPVLQLPPDSVPEPIDSILNSGPIAIPTLAPPPGQSQALAEAMAEFDMLTRSRREAEARARDAQVASLATPIVHPQPVQAAAPVPEQVELPASVPQPPVQQVSVPQPPVMQVPVQNVESYPTTATLPSPPAPDNFTQQSVPSVTSVEQPPALAAPIFSDPPSAVLSPAQPSAVPSAPTADSGRSPRAAGHWRVQAEAENDELPYENTISRTVGASPSAITTSALVLPSVPQPDNLLNAITATGEILVTGTIDLPRSLGSTGAHPNRIDNSDFEDDPLDSQVAAPDSAPIRAIRAVSTNTSTRGVIETKKPAGTRMLTTVIVIASVLCVSLVGLLVFAFATNKL